MQLIRLAHIGIRVADFARSVAFYRAFGFTVTREDQEAHVVVLQHPCGLELNLLDTANSQNPDANILMDIPEKFPGYTHMALETDAVSAAVELLNDLQIPITQGPVTFGDGSTSVFFRDPDRNVIEITQRRRTH